MVNSNDIAGRVEKRLIMDAMGRGDRPIQEKEIDVIRSVMIKGNYPASITDCEVVGISGGCGKDCPVLQRGDCNIIEEGIADGVLTKDEAIELGYDL